MDAMPQQLSLTLPEHDRLAELEAVVERGVQTFVEVGDALAEIRDRRLYRGTHGTFEAYCGNRWGIARSTAYQLIEAAEVVENVRHGGHETLPANERQARPLAALPAEQQPEAWALALAEGNGKPTAADVKRAVAILVATPEGKRAVAATAKAFRAGEMKAKREARSAAWAAGAQLRPDLYPSPNGGRALSVESDDAERRWRVVFGPNAAGVALAANLAELETDPTFREAQQEIEALEQEAAALEAEAKGSRELASRLKGERRRRMLETLTARHGKPFPFVESMEFAVDTEIHDRIKATMPTAEAVVGFLLGAPPAPGVRHVGTSYRGDIRWLGLIELPPAPPADPARPDHQPGHDGWSRLGFEA